MILSWSQKAVKDNDCRDFSLVHALELTDIVLTKAEMLISIKWCGSLEDEFKTTGNKMKLAVCTLTA